MRHFDFLDEDDVSRLFHQAPRDLDLGRAPRELALGLGATLYVPATRPKLADDLLRARRQGVVSSVVCLEDAIPDSEVARAQAHVVDVLGSLADRRDEIPLTFVRVRTARQIEEITAGLGDRHAAVTGFVLPKFGTVGGRDFLEAVSRSSERLGRPLWVMPVIETPAVMHRETRHQELVDVRTLLGEWREHVLAVRIGATDLASVYGLRRPRELTVYDVRLVADAITDIVNILGRLDDGFVVTGPVWEYFFSSERLFKPQLRETPFSVHEERALRASLIAKDLDGLIREVVLDRANGLAGKTVIHPSHVSVVHALSVVTHEEHVDALDIVGAAGGGAASSNFGNKMNEANPHRAWAETILRRAEVFGVSGEDVSFVDLLAACLRV